jgi:hypothetical protein
MSKVTNCPDCGARIEVPAYPGDGVYSTPHCCAATRRYEQMWGRYIDRSEDTKRAFVSGWNARG